MSCFMLSDRTIATIANSLDLPEHKFSAQKILGIIYSKEIDYNSSVSRKDCENIALHMHLLNLDAIEARYGYKARLEESRNFDFDFLCDCNTIQLYVSLKSFLYQCSSIDDYRSNKLYMALKEYLSFIADELISSAYPTMSELSRS